MAASKNLTAQQRVKRAQDAARARTTVDYHIQKVVGALPRMTEEQREYLRSLLAPGVAAVSTPGRKRR